MKNPPLFLGNPSPPFLKNPSPLFRKVTPIFRKPSPSFLQTPGGFSENTYPILQKPRGLYACGGRFFCIRWGNQRGNFVGKPRRRRHFHRARIPPSPPNPGSETTGLLPPASISLRKDHPLRKRRFSFRRSFAIMRALSSLGQPLCGRVAEWSNAPDSKSGIRLYRIEGSNPSPSARY